MTEFKQAFSITAKVWLSLLLIAIGVGVIALIIAAVGNSTSSVPPPSIVSQTSAQEQQAQDQPKWGILDGDANIEGVKTISAYLEATDSKSELQLRKRGGTFEVILVPSQFVGLEGSTVKWKVGDGSVRAEHWGSSSDGQGLFAGNASSFLLAVSHGGTLTLEYKPYDYLAETMHFALPSTLPDAFQSTASHAVAVQKVNAQVESAQQDYEACLDSDTRDFKACANAFNQRVHGLAASDAQPAADSEYKTCMTTVGTVQADCDAIIGGHR